MIVELGAGDDWRERRLHFSALAPHLDTRRLRRLGIVAIGRAMEAELCLAGTGFD